MSINRDLLREAHIRLIDLTRGNYKCVEDLDCIARIGAALAQPEPSLPEWLRNNPFELLDDCVALMRDHDGALEYEGTLKRGTMVWTAYWTEEQIQMARRNAKEIHERLAQPEPEPAQDAERWRCLISLSTLRASHLIDKHGTTGLAYVIDKERSAVAIAHSPAQPEPVTLERLRAMFEDYRDAWSPGARDELLASFHAELSAHPPAQAVPEGWVLVPKEPTLEMLQAGENCNIGSSADPWSWSRNEYKATIAAPPKPEDK